jgi:hypothetical protein
MPDPNLPPLIITFSTPGTPQPYQERILAALENGSRLETWQERWDRERNESLERLYNAIGEPKEGLLVIGRNTNGAPLSFFARHYITWRQPPAWHLMAWHAGPTIGRKRRARRARGRRRGNA